MSTTHSITHSTTHTDMSTRTYTTVDDIDKDEGSEKKAAAKLLAISVALRTLLRITTATLATTLTTLPISPTKTDMKALTTQLHEKCLHVAEELPKSQHDAREAIYTLSDEVERLQAVIRKIRSLAQSEADDQGATAND